MLAILCVGFCVADDGFVLVTINLNAMLVTGKKNNHQKS